MEAFECGVSFTFTPGRHSATQGALGALRALLIEAPSQEAAEHYAAMIVRALEEAANRE